MDPTCSSSGCGLAADLARTLTNTAFATNTPSGDGAGNSPTSSCGTAAGSDLHLEIHRLEHGLGAFDEVLQSIPASRRTRTGERGRLPDLPQLLRQVQILQNVHFNGSKKVLRRRR
jgi:hypothetical protein